MQKAETKDTALRRIHTGGGRTGQMSLEPRGKLGEVSWTRKQQNQMLTEVRKEGCSSVHWEESPGESGGSNFSFRYRAVGGWETASPGDSRENWL